MKKLFVLSSLFLLLSGCIGSSDNPNVYYFKDQNVIGGFDSNKIMVSSNDTTANYLESKIVAGSDISLVVQNEGGNENILISATGAASSYTDLNQVKVSANDTTPGYLENKVVGGMNLTTTTLNDGGNEQIQFNVDLNGYASGNPDTNCSTSPDCNTMYWNATGDLTPTGAYKITNTTTSNALQVIQIGNTSNSTSVGGAINLNNTANTGAGIVVYSNQDSTATGHLIAGRADDSTFDQSVYYGTSAGNSHTMTMLYTGTGTSSAAINVSSSNPNFTSFQVSGVETDHGTIKVSHTGSGTDGSAAGLSIDAKGEGTASQGIFVNSTASTGTQGDLLTLRNRSVELFSVDKNGGTRITTDLSNAFIVETNSTNDLFRIDTVNTEIQSGAIFPNGNAAQAFGKSDKLWDVGWFQELCLTADCRTTWPTSGGSGTTYTSGTPATIQVNNDTNTISQNFDGNFWLRFTQGETYIDGNALAVINSLDLNNSLGYVRNVIWNAAWPPTDANIPDNITVNWTGLQNYPTGGTGSQAVQTIGDTLTFLDVPTEAAIDANSLAIINALDLNNSLNYVEIDGDTMTGPLTITSTNANALLVEDVGGTDKLRVDTSASIIYTVLIRPTSDNAIDIGQTAARYRDAWFSRDINAMRRITSFDINFFGVMGGATANFIDLNATRATLKDLNVTNDLNVGRDLNVTDNLYVKNNSYFDGNVDVIDSNVNMKSNCITFGISIVGRLCMIVIDGNATLIWGK